MNQIWALALGQGISQFGSSFINIGFVYWIKSSGGSGTMIGAFFFCAALAVGLMSLVIGPILDARSKSRIVLVSDVCGALLMLGFAAGARYGGGTRYFVFCIFAVKIILSCLYAIRTSAISALVPELIDKGGLKKANSLMASSRNISMVLAEAFGGVAFSAFGLAALAALDSFSYFVATAFNIPICAAHEKSHGRDAEKKTELGFIDSIKQGWAYCFATDGVKEFSLLLLFFGFFYSPVVVWLPFLVDNVMGLSAGWYGYFVSTVSAGVFFGAMAVGLVSRMRTSPVSVLFLLGVVFVVAGVGSSRYLLLGAVFLIGFLTGVFNTLAASAIQNKVPRAMLGRVFSILTAISLIVGPLSKALNGVLVDFVGGRVSVLFLASGISMLAGALFAFRSRNLRMFLGE